MSDFSAELLENFRWFHRHPELALCEHETTARIREILGGLPGVELLDLGLSTGALARVRGNADGPTVALRADIDALPILEETQLPYASENPGRMHACGHDFHTAALLGAARLLGEQRDQLPGTVVLLFQPAEEAEHGAQRVVETDFIAREGVRQIFGLHVAEGLPVGAVAMKPGPDHAAVDRFLYRIHGTGCHGASPQSGHDPIPAAARLVGALQEIVSRSVSPMQSAVVSVTRIQSGSSWNIIPASAELEGTVRSFDPAVREDIVRRMRALAKGLEAEEYRVEFDWIPGCPATNNDPALIELAADCARREGFEVRPAEAVMGGEDFSCYQQRIPGAFFHIGTGDSAPAHNSRFAVDPAPLPAAARLMARIARTALERLQEAK